MSDLYRSACGIGQLGVVIESGLVGKGLIDVMLYIEKRSWGQIDVAKDEVENAWAEWGNVASPEFLEYRRHCR